MGTVSIKEAFKALRRRSKGVDAEGVAEGAGAEGAEGAVDEGGEGGEVAEWTPLAPPSEEVMAGYRRAKWAERRALLLEILGSLAFFAVIIGISWFVSGMGPVASFWLGAVAGGIFGYRLGVRWARGIVESPGSARWVPTGIGARRG